MKLDKGVGIRLNAFLTLVLDRSEFYSLATSGEGDPGIHWMGW